MAPTKASARQSSVSSLMRGVVDSSVGMSETNQAARPAPRAPPSAAMRNPSRMTVPIARAREAPRAARMASSRARRWTWTSVSPAMLATAMIHKDVDRAENQHQPAPRIGDARLLERAHLRRPPGVGLGELPGECLLHRGQLAPGRFRADTGAQPSDALHEPGVAQAQEPGVGLCRQPHVGRGARERAGHHADDRIRTAADDERASESRRITLEAPRPEPFADDRRARSVLLLFIVGEPAAGKWRHRVDSEEARRDTAAFQPFGLRAARVRHVLRIAS